MYCIVIKLIIIRLFLSSFFKLYCVDMLLNADSHMSLCLFTLVKCDVDFMLQEKYDGKEFLIYL